MSWPINPRSSLNVAINSVIYCNGAIRNEDIQLLDTLIQRL